MTGVTKMTKGLDNGFHQKFEIFDVILESKKRFKTIKNRNLKKWKN